MQPPSSKARKFRPSVEPLEDRRLPAAALTATLANGILTVEGTDGPNSIALWQAHGRFAVIGISIDTAGGPASSVDVTQVKGIVINTLGGNDDVWLDQDKYGSDRILLPATINAGSGNDYLAAGWGNTVINGGTGNDTLVGGAGRDTLIGGGAHDDFYAGSGGGVLQGGPGVNFFDTGTGNPTVVKSGTMNYVANQWAVGGAEPQDVVQQNAPTCSFLASLAALAEDYSSYLAAGITYLGNSNYGVRLFQAGAAAGTGQWITENVYFDGTLSTYDAQPVSGGSFWAVLYQRAWNKMRAAQGLDNAAWPDEALTALTGLTVPGYLPTVNAQEFAQVVNGGYPVVAATLASQSAISSKLVANHAYTVLSVDSAGNAVLRNPWGFDGGKQASGAANDGIVTISWAEFQQSMVAFWVG